MANFPGGLFWQCRLSRMVFEANSRCAPLVFFATIAMPIFPEVSALQEKGIQLVLELFSDRM